MLALLASCWSVFSQGSASTPAPAALYPPSPVIRSVAWDFEHLIRKAHGSDLWPTTWAADDQIYTGWGDGGGFDGDSDRLGRVSVGFARISGLPPGITGQNVWGDQRGGYALHPSTFLGKPEGMLAVGGVLYAWISSYYNTAGEPNPVPAEHSLAWSSDRGATWQRAMWKLSEANGSPFFTSFLNFGRDYAGARDRYVYVYGGIGGKAGSILARVPIARLRDRGAYRFFAGLDARRHPIWSADAAHCRPVLQDQGAQGAAGASIPTVVYSPAIRRYIATCSQDGTVGGLSIFDAAQPWGPWATVAAYQNWGGFGAREALLWSFPAKWISADGKTMWCVFSAGRVRPSDALLDSFNLVKATLTLQTAR